MQYLLYGVVLIACQISLALNVFAADGRLIHPVVASVQDGKGKVRVGDAVILINDEGKAVMNFIAVSLDKHCNIGGTLSSWLDVKLLDKDKKPLGGFSHVKEAAVEEAGHQQAHNNVELKPAHFPPDFVKHAEHFEMNLPGKIGCK